jgi:hypothetical protein
MGKDWLVGRFEMAKDSGHFLSPRNHSLSPPIVSFFGSVLIRHNLIPKVFLHRLWFSTFLRRNERSLRRPAGEEARNASPKLVRAILDVQLARRIDAKPFYSSSVVLRRSLMPPGVNL